MTRRRRDERWEMGDETAAYERLRYQTHPQGKYQSTEPDWGKEKRDSEIRTSMLIDISR